MHDRSSPIVKVVPFLDGNDLRIDSPLLNSTAGRDAAEELRSGVLTGLSVEFNATKETRRNGLRVIQKAILAGAGLVDFSSYTLAKAELRARSNVQQKDCEIMAVTLTDAELSAGMMLTGATGSALDTPPEPILGRIQRFKAVATAIVTARLIETAPDDVANEIVVKMCTYWWNQSPAARMAGFANAFVNSGAASIAADWMQRQSWRSL